MVKKFFYLKILLPVALTVILGGYYYSFNFTPDLNSQTKQVIIENTEQDYSSHSTEHINSKKKQDSLKAQEQRFLAKLNEEHPKKDILNETDTQVLLTKSFKRMHAMGNFFNAKSLQREEIQALLEKPANLEKAQNILLDINTTLSDFGEDQALARVYAIKMLEEQARLGDIKPLYDVSTQLAEQLNHQIESGIELEKGREYDLESLLNIAVKQVNIEELSDPNNVAALLNQSGFRDDMSKQIISYYDNAVFFPLLKKYGREKAKIIVAQVIDVGQNATNTVN
ncbi:hypothetical protein [uncultured Shewanella sp.]|uniref:hypothetical protein n=1 Tax=uncultured Shewanella sp. TaxID=173975 RepID=UPI00262CEEF1|nr:hypothetical protein [uncultured Shewanella sp.]